MQADLLRKEGVAVSEELRINLDKYLWDGLQWYELDEIIKG
jgi:alkylated DNA nucleotide flippase Atl1